MDTKTSQGSNPVEGQRDGHELFIGLVGATGSDLQGVCSCIKEALQPFGYKVEKLKFSQFFEDNTNGSQQLCPLEHIKSEKAKKIYSQMEKGNAMRKKFKDPSILAKYAVKEINNKRPKTEESGTPKEKRGTISFDYQRNKETAYVFDSLKHHEESILLKKIYGASYYQIGVYSDKNKRISCLEKTKDIPEGESLFLIEKDMFEENKYGQKTRKVFELSDFFIKHDYMAKNKTKEHINRIFDLIFGNPYLTPTIDEHMMYMAYAYSTRSADLSRQVGAVIANKSGDILSLGSNDVPRPGGGPYWPDYDKDYRDHSLGEDSNQVRRDKVLKKARKTIRENLLKNLKDKVVASTIKLDEKQVKKILSLLQSDEVSNDTTSGDEFKEDFKDSGLLDVTEYGRVTHAEMSAILSCARNGVNLKGCTLYCTTYPCHNCAKHIIDSGIKKVLFVEPYPKSLAKELHCDAILSDSWTSIEEVHTNKVVFDHFIGVSARRYLDIFSFNLGVGEPLKRKDKNSGEVIQFDRNTKNVRNHAPKYTYIEREDLIVKDLNPGGPNG